MPAQRRELWTRWTGRVLEALVEGRHFAELLALRWAAAPAPDEDGDWLIPAEVRKKSSPLLPYTLPIPPKFP